MDPQEVRRGSIFISHVGPEATIALYLKSRLDVDFLGSLDIFVSSDQTTIAAGARWLDEVERALKNTDLEVVLCSADSVSRPWVNFEAGAVWLTGVPVVPVCHSGMTADRLPVPLNLLQAIEASDPKGLARLYATVSRITGFNVPRVDFDALALEFRSIEEQYARAREAVERVEEPTILCAASEQYAEPQFGFDRDVAVLERCFPGRVVVERGLTRAGLRRLLTNHSFTIVHLVLPVDEATGDLIFSRVDPADVRARPLPGAETLSPQGFAALVVESGTRLVVLATCDALLLAVEVSGLANMAASDTMIFADAVVEWEECFYTLLAEGKSVYKAFDLAKSLTQVPMRHIRHRDVVFGPRPLAAAGSAAGEPTGPRFPSR